MIQTSRAKAMNGRDWRRNGGARTQRPNRSLNQGHQHGTWHLDSVTFLADDPDLDSDSDSVPPFLHSSSDPFHNLHLAFALLVYIIHVLVDMYHSVL
jgi:hypothetical protein